MTEKLINIVVVQTIQMNKNNDNYNNAIIFIESKTNNRRRQTTYLPMNKTNWPVEFSIIVSLCSKKLFL